MSTPSQEPAATKSKKEKKEKKTTPSAPAEKMIIVNVNDRLGTKAAIPCLPSDPISEWSSCQDFVHQLMALRTVQSYCSRQNRPGTS